MASQGSRTVGLAARAGIALAAILCGCERNPPAIRFRLAEPQTVSVGILDAQGHCVDQPLTAVDLPRGRHRTDLPSDRLAPGRYSWQVWAYPRARLEPVAGVGEGIGKLRGGDAGPPCAVAAEGGRVFLGWRMAREGYEVVACTPAGDPLWGYHHGPVASGVWDLAADGDHLYVLGGAEGLHAEGGAVYRLEAATGRPAPWNGGDRIDLPIASLWVQDGTPKPLRADHLAADRGRLYLTFGTQGFIAVLDAATGAYVTTLTAPRPGRIALSTTPMTDPAKPGAMRTVDFGIAAIRGNGLAFFIMEHDPPWVMLSTTRWLPEGEPVTALALRGDTMRSSNLTVFTALGAPLHQIQVRPADTVEAFTATLGEPGGRRADLPHGREAFRDVRALAVDATGALWVAECEDRFGRFTVWRADMANRWGLEREILGPWKEPDLHFRAGETTRPVIEGIPCRFDFAGRRIETWVPLPRSDHDRAEATVPELRTPAGVVLWPGMDPPERGLHAVVEGVPGGGHWVWSCGNGVRVSALRGPHLARRVAAGEFVARGP